MAKPEFEATAGIYILRWPEQKILMRLDRLKERSDSVSAEITIKSTLADLPSHLHMARLNLTSTAAQKTLSKVLEDRFGAMVPWADMVEQARVMVLTRHREGDPPICLGEIPEREGLGYRIYPLALEKQINVLYGDGGTGKSMLALFVSILVESPLDEAGFRVEPGNVLYQDYEADKEETSRRTRMLQKGLGIETASRIMYRFGRVPVADDIEQLQRIVAEHEIDLIIVDSLGMAIGGDQDKSADPIRCYQTLRTLGCTALVIDHRNKEGKQYGNIYKYLEARQVWHCKAMAEPGTDILTIGLYHEKNNAGKKLNPLGLEIQFREEGYFVKRKDLTLVPELAKDLPLRQQIEALLRHGALPVEDLAQELSVTVATARTTLNRHKALFQPVYQDGVREHLWGLRTVEP